MFRIIELSKIQAPRFERPIFDFMSFKVLSLEYSMSHFRVPECTSFELTISRNSNLRFSVFRIDDVRLSTLLVVVIFHLIANGSIVLIYNLRCLVWVFSFQEFSLDIPVPYFGVYDLRFFEFARVHLLHIFTCMTV